MLSCFCWFRFTANRLVIVRILTLETTLSSQIHLSIVQSHNALKPSTSRTMTRTVRTSASTTLPHREAPMATPNVDPPRSAPSPNPTVASTFKPESYTQPFCDFMTANPTVYHAVAAVAAKLEAHGYKRLSERDSWSSALKPGGKYFFDRNGSGLVAFAIGADYAAGHGAAVIGAHIDALTARLKPVSTKPTRQGYEQLGVAHYGGALSDLWQDRDLGIAGRVFVRDPDGGKVEMRLVKLGWPIARIPSIAPHFGLRPEGQPNRETRMTPIIGVDNGGLHGGAKKANAETETDGTGTMLGSAGAFVATQPPKLVKMIAGEIGVQDHTQILNWDLELFDTQPAQVGGLEKDFIFAGRIDDKMCSWAAVEALLLASTEGSGLVKVVGLFDDEEVGSLLRQGAKSNFLTSAIERITAAFAKEEYVANLYRTYANSFLISADVCHAFNPNYADMYLDQHTPRLNVGVTVSYDSNAHMTTGKFSTIPTLSRDFACQYRSGRGPWADRVRNPDAASTSVLQRIAEKSGSALQAFQIRNDSR